MSRKIYGVFSGGGVKAAAFVGAIKEAENHVTFEGVGGSSAGALVATLLAVGYRATDLRRLLFDAPYGEFFKPNWARFLYSPGSGLCPPDPLLKWIRRSICDGLNIPRSEVVTFERLRELRPGGPTLKIVTTNLTTREIEVLSSATEKNNHEIAQAVLASCSFPVVFPFVKKGTDDLTDGGVLSNLPMWLFDEERESGGYDNPVVGFALHAVGHEHPTARRSFPSRLISVFESVAVAQDRVQEKYLDGARAADVIRIEIPPTATFDRAPSKDAQTALFNAGQLAASEYFRNAPLGTQQRVNASGSDKANTAEARSLVATKRYGEALSLIARRHLLRGGVALDQGAGKRRKFVRYYVDLMNAATELEKLTLMAEILAAKLPATKDYARIIGLKKGNALLAARVATMVAKPFALMKTDVTYKMGLPFDGDVVAGEKVVVVDDVASDASILLYAIHRLSSCGVSVSTVVCLIERLEGDARQELLNTRYCALESVCVASDADIDALIDSGKPLPSVVW